MTSGSLLPLTSQASPTYPDDHLIIDMFDGSQRSVETHLDDGGSSMASSVTISNHAVVRKASVNLTFGQHPDNGSLPLDPSLDIGGDGVMDWVFDSQLLGPLGSQDRLGGKTFPQELVVSGGGTPDLDLTLPLEADIKEAYFDVEATPLPHWVQQYNLTPPGVSPGDSRPYPMEFRGEMYVAWESMDPMLTDGYDLDIVIRKYDGTMWYPIEELTPAQDIWEDIYPKLIVFRDRLYCFWSSGDGRFIMGGQSELVYRFYDGTTWSPVERISGPREDGVNTHESCAVFQDKLYVFWRTYDPNVSNQSEDFPEDMDIVGRALDGDEWGEIIEVSAPENDGLDWMVDLEVFQDRLYVVWDYTEFKTRSGIFPKPKYRDFASDIKMRTFNGTEWTPEEVFSPPGNTTVYPFQEIDENIPKLHVYHNPVTKDDELFVIWTRGTPSEDPLGGYDGDGSMVVMRRLYKGSWTEMLILSFPPMENDMYHMFPNMFTYNDTLYAIWVMGNKTVTKAEGSMVTWVVYGNIVMKAFDGAHWSSLIELTPMGNRFDEASHPYMIEYGGKFYATWETPLVAPNGTVSWEVVMRHLETFPVTIRVQVGDTNPTVWGWERLGNDKRRVHLDTEALEASLLAQEPTEDAYRNLYCTLPFDIREQATSVLTISEFKVLYDLDVVVDFTGVASEMVRGARTNDHVDEDVEIPFVVSSAKACNITLGDLLIEHYLDFPPVLAQDVPAIEVPEDVGGTGVLDLENHFTDDWDDGRLMFEVTNHSLPYFIEIRLNGSILSIGTPVENWFGEATIGLRAFDSTDFYYTDSNPILVTIIPVNDPPELSPIPFMTLQIDTDFNWSLEARDVDDTELVFSCDTDLVSVDSETRELRVRMTEGFPNPLVVEITVSDTHGATDMEVVELSYEPLDKRVESQDTCIVIVFILAIAIAGLVVVLRLRLTARQY